MKNFKFDLNAKVAIYVELMVQLALFFGGICVK